MDRMGSFEVLARVGKKNVAEVVGLVERIEASGYRLFRKHIVHEECKIADAEGPSLAHLFYWLPGE